MRPGREKVIITRDLLRAKQQYFHDRRVDPKSHADKKNYTSSIFLGGTRLDILDSVCQVVLARAWLIQTNFE